MVVVGRPGVVAWTGRGYLLQNHVIRNAKDLVIKTKNMGIPMLISASRSALMKTKPKP